MLHKKRKPSTFTSSSGVDCKYDAAQKHTLHSKSTYFYRWVPFSCSLALLLGLGIIVNPVVDKAAPVYAATDDECKTTPDDKGVCAMELGITMQGSDGSDVVGAYTEQPATALSTEEAAFRSYSFKVRAIDTDKDGYKLYANAVPTTLDGKDYTNKLVNADYPEFSINPLGAETTGTAIPAGQWGYALTGGKKEGSPALDAPANSLTYKAVPTGTTADVSSVIDAGDDTGLESDIHTDQQYKIHFGARADEGMASGHYRTQVLLSLVASPKKIAKGGFGGVTKMSEFTSAVCKSIDTPTTGTPAAEVPTGQLIDDREGEDGTKYWVAKFADGDCWMTQNMAYDGISNTSGNFNKTKKNTLLAPNDVNNPTSYSEKATTGYTLSEDPVMTAVLDESTKTYNGHYLLGNYYAQDNNQAANACTFSGNADWKLPAASSASATGAHQSFGRLLGTYSVPNSGAGSLTMRKPPFYFLYAGGYDGGFYAIGSDGNYWSSTSGRLLYLTSSGANPSYSFYTGGGNSVRCVVSGA